MRGGKVREGEICYGKLKFVNTPVLYIALVNFSWCVIIGMHVRAESCQYTDNIQPVYANLVWPKF